MRLKRLFLSFSCILLSLSLAGQAAASQEGFAKDYVEMMLAHIHTLAVARAADTLTGKPYNPKNVNLDLAQLDRQSLELQYSSLVPYYFQNGKTGGNKAPTAEEIKKLARGHILHAFALSGLAADWGSGAVASYADAGAGTTLDHLSDVTYTVDPGANQLQRNRLEDVIADGLLNQAEASNKKIFGYVLGQTLHGELPLMGYLWAGLTSTEPTTQAQDKALSQALYKKLADYLDKSLADIEYRLRKTRTVHTKLPLYNRADLNTLNRNAATTLPTFVNPGGADADVNAFWGAVNTREEPVRRYALRTRHDKELNELVQAFANTLTAPELLARWAGAPGAGGVNAGYRLQDQAHIHNAAENLSNLLAKSLRSKLKGDTTGTDADFKDANAAGAVAKTKANVIDDYRDAYRAEMVAIKGSTLPTHNTFKDTYRTYPQFMYEVNEVAQRRLVPTQHPQFLRKGLLLATLAETVEERLLGVGHLGQRGSIADDTAWGVLHGIMTQVQAHAIDATQQDKWVNLLKTVGGPPQLPFHNLAGLARETNDSFQRGYQAVKNKADASASAGIEKTKKDLAEYLKRLIESEALLTDNEVSSLLTSINNLNSEALYKTVVAQLNTANSKIDYFPVLSTLPSTGFNKGTTNPGTKSGRDPTQAPRNLKEAEDNDVPLSDENRIYERRLSYVQARLAGKVKGKKAVTHQEKSALRKEAKELQKKVKVQREVLKLSPKAVRQEVTRLKKRKNLGASSKERLRILEKRLSDLTQTSKLSGITKKIVKKSAELKNSKTPAQQSKLKAEIERLKKELNTQKASRAPWKLKKQGQAKAQ